MKKLFCVKNSAGKLIPHNGRLYWDNKMEAKAFRDERGEGHRVSRGPDNPPSPTGVPRMRRQPKK